MAINFVNGCRLRLSIGAIKRTDLLLEVEKRPSEHVAKGGILIAM